MNKWQKVFNVEWITFWKPETRINLFLWIFLNGYSFVNLWNSRNWVFWLTKDLVSWIVVWLVFLSMHDAVSTIFCQLVSKLTSFTAWETTFIFNLWCSTKVSSWCHCWLSFFISKLWFQKVANFVFLKLCFIDRYEFLNELSKINFENAGILIKTLKSFDLINLRQIHLVFYHIVSTFKYVLLTCVVVDVFDYNFASAPCFNFCLDKVSLIFFQNLLSGDYVLNFLVYFVFFVPIENVWNCL